MPNEQYLVLDHGVRWGDALIEFIASDPKAGRMLEIRTDTQRLQVRVTPRGKFRFRLDKKRAIDTWDHRFSA